MRQIRWGAAVALATYSCSGSPTMPSVPVGSWGGDHIALTVAATSSHVEFDCAHGDISGPFTVDARNQFYVPGTFTREHGGPIIVPPPPPDSHPAVYAGFLNGDTMTMTVQLTDTQTAIGTFTLTHGSPGRVVKCLLPLAVGRQRASRTSANTVASGTLGDRLPSERDDRSV